MNCHGHSRVINFEQWTFSSIRSVTIRCATEGAIEMNTDSLARALGALALFLAVATAASPATAAFPGENGLIVFDTQDGGTSQIDTVRPDGSDVRQLTDESSGGAAMTPHWSVDGRLIVYAGDQTGNRKIYVMNADGSGKRRLTNSSEFGNAWPSLSPDGSTMTFSRCSRFLGIRDVAAMRSDGKSARRHARENATETAGGCDGRDLVLDVVVMDTAGTPAPILEEAGLEVARIWSAGGIRLDWILAREAQARPDRLLVPVVIWPERPASTSTSHRPLGWVAVDPTGRATGTIEIPVQDVVNLMFSSERTVKSLSPKEQDIVGRALGRVIAHEVGHWLFGPSHTDDGLMTRAFDLRTLSLPGVMPLPRAWTDDKGRLIARSTRCLAGAEQTRGVPLENLKSDIVR